RGFRIPLAVYLEDDIQKLLLNLAEILFLALGLTGRNVSFERLFEFLKLGQRRTGGSIALAGPNRLGMTRRVPNHQRAKYPERFPASMHQARPPDSSHVCQLSITLRRPKLVLEAMKDVPLRSMVAARLDAFDPYAFAAKACLVCR